MAKGQSVWGIEIGQSALKALRCSMDGEQVIAEAFDYIEYPKILSQPEADPEVMVHEALETFVSRNDLKKTQVAVSVAGQNGLAKFFKPPPVELKKIHDIVRYEARQQIPFELDDVIWDYQLMAGGDISEGFALEAEVGLFAMKRDAVYRALKPLEGSDVDVDLLQLAPLSIYNAVSFDRQLIDEEYDYNPEHPPKSTVVLAMGTDSTDLIVTNGYRVWQRSMPLGGNHFTRQLTKDLKLTFAKAEHLKRNAMEADDPKLIFQAMRPVFNDLVTEVQRSMGFFRSLNKQAEIGSILMLGNSVKLPGLTQYLSKNLAMDVEVIDSFSRLDGEDVTTAPAFKDHISSFVPVYGLCLQGLSQGSVSTNLVPKEVVQERLINAKKPWAVAAAALLMLGFATNLLFAGTRWGYVHPTKWQTAMDEADRTKTTSDDAIKDDEAQVGRIDLLTQIGADVSGSGDRRILWLEIINALYEALGRPEGYGVDAPLPSPEEVPYDERTVIYISKMECQSYDDISEYLSGTIANLYNEDKKTRLVRLGLLEEPAEGEEGAEAAEESSEEGEGGLEPPEVGEDEEGNKAWVIELEGYHYHNGQKYAATGDELEEFVLKTLVHRLETGSAKLPVTKRDENGNVVTEDVEFTYKELGLMYPFVLRGTPDPEFKLPNPEWTKKYGASGMGGGMGMGMGMGGPGGGMGGGYGGEGGYGMGGGYGGEGGYGMGGGYGGEGGYGGGSGGYGGAPGGQSNEDEDGLKKFFDAPKYSFTLQVVWKEKPLSERLEAKRIAEEEAAALAEEEGLAANEGEEEEEPAL